MSYLMFGTMTPVPPILLQQAQQCGISLRMERPKIVDEMLHMMGRLRDQYIAFLIVADPDHDTSDSVISPFAQSLDTICANLGYVQRWLEEITAHPGVAVRLYITEGFDVEFNEVVVAARDFQETLCGIIRNEGDWPSLMIKVLSSSQRVTDSGVR